MDNEEWKDVPGYEGYYQVSSLGNMRSVTRFIKLATRWGGVTTRRQPGKKLKPYTDKDGYYGIILSKKNKQVTFRLHRVVFLAFNGFLPEEVNHINGIKKENSLKNLEKSDRKHNARHASENNLMLSGERHKGSKLNNKSVSEIVSHLMEDKISATNISKIYNVSSTSILNINKGLIWRDITSRHTKRYPIRNCRVGSRKVT